MSSVRSYAIQCLRSRGNRQGRRGERRGPGAEPAVHAMPAYPHAGNLMTAAVDAREGGRIWYRIGGGEAAPLVIVHGGPGATHDYLEPLEALADGRPAVFYHQLGAGTSHAPDDVPADATRPARMPFSAGTRRPSRITRDDDGHG